MTNAEARFNNSLRPREPEGSLGRTAQDGHLDSHTAPELWGRGGFHVALRPRRRDGLLGTGTEWEGDDRVKARPRNPLEKDQRPWTAARTMEVLRRCPLAIAQRLVHCAAIAVSTAVLGQSQRQCPLHCC